MFKAGQQLLPFSGVILLPEGASLSAEVDSSTAEILRKLLRAVYPG